MAVYKVVIRKCLLCCILFGIHFRYAGLRSALTNASWADEPLGYKQLEAATDRLLDNIPKKLLYAGPQGPWWFSIKPVYATAFFPTCDNKGSLEMTPDV